MVGESPLILWWIVVLIAGKKGMVKAVADVNGPEAAAGFVSDDSKITGFSHLHDSGKSASFTMNPTPTDNVGRNWWRKCFYYNSLE